LHAAALAGAGAIQAGTEEDPWDDDWPGTEY
jgi:hypothetical protein